MRNGTIDKMALVAAVLLWVAPSRTAAVPVLVAAGPAVGFLAPHPPYTQDNFTLEIMFGYGSDLDTIGEDLWHTGPGIYDLSTQPGHAGFLAYATNGVADNLIVSVRDQEGFVVSYPWFSESIAYLHDPDLHSLEVTSVSLEVIGLHLATAELPYDAISARLLFYGVPEPATAGLLIAGGLLLARRSCAIRAC